MAKDIIHNAVKNALIKDGWIITDDPFRIIYEEFELFADLAAERTPIVAKKDGQKIVVEIKTFGGRSFVKDLQQALGQYTIYRDLMELTGAENELYLAISEFVYNEFFMQRATQAIVQRHQLLLIVVNIEREEIVRWIN
ncbi:MAG: XisH protein [Desulfobacteraceae bacterium]|nr:XisH protein [Desulfobacteraceae bacterium]